jgi:hypothetical protein
MDSLLLTFHSIFRWLVIISLCFAIFLSAAGWINGSAFSKFDDRVRALTASIVHIQFLLGIWLYFASSSTMYFLNHFSEAMHVKESRFFGMEHTLLMLVAIIIISFGSSKVKSRKTDIGKFKTVVIWFGIGLLIILVAIPWPFSPFAVRPWIRWF